MSQKNRLLNKSIRRNERAARPYPQRRAVSTIDLESSAGVLCEPHKHGAGIGARGRKYLMRSRADLLVMPVTPAKTPAVKLALKLETLTLVQLLRRRSQFARRAATARHLLADMDLQSRFRPPLQARQDAALRAFTQVKAEIEARTLHARGEFA